MSKETKLKDYIVLKGTDQILTHAKDPEDKVLVCITNAGHEMLDKDVVLLPKDSDIAFASDVFLEVREYVNQLPITTLSERFLDKYMFPPVMRYVYKKAGIMGFSLDALNEQVTNDLFGFIAHLKAFIKIEKLLTELKEEGGYIAKYNIHHLEYFGDNKENHIFLSDGATYQKILSKVITYCYDVNSVLLSINYDTTGYTHTFSYLNGKLYSVTKSKQMLGVGGLIFIGDDKPKDEAVKKPLSVVERQPITVEVLRTLITTGADVTKVDTSAITDMSYLFEHANTFNQDISGWDTSNVTDMEGMFVDTIRFNQDISGWDVSNVTNMDQMFRHAKLFNQDISNWNTSKVTDMRAMFMYTHAFNQPIGKWDVSNVVDLHGMFFDAIAFNQPLDNWNISNVTDIGSMFKGATAFNQDVNNWDTSKVEDMSWIFCDVPDFNHPLDKWDTSKVTNMAGMFKGAKSFKQDISGWNVKAVTDMMYMFHETPAFDQGSIGNWDITSAALFSIIPENDETKGDENE